MERRLRTDFHLLMPWFTWSFNAIATTVTISPWFKRPSQRFAGRYGRLKLRGLSLPSSEPPQKKNQSRVNWIWFTKVWQQRPHGVKTLKQLKNYSSWTSVDYELQVLLQIQPWPMILTSLLAAVQKTGLPYTMPWSGDVHEKMTKIPTSVCIDILWRYSCSKKNWVQNLILQPIQWHHIKLHHQRLKGVMQLRLPGQQVSTEALPRTDGQIISQRNVVQKEPRKKVLPRQLSLSRKF